MPLDTKWKRWLFVACLILGWIADRLAQFLMVDRMRRRVPAGLVEADDSPVPLIVAARYWRQILREMDEEDQQDQPNVSASRRQRPPKVET